MEAVEEMTRVRGQPPRSCRVDRKNQTRFWSSFSRREFVSRVTTQEKSRSAKRELSGASASRRRNARKNHFIRSSSNRRRRLASRGKKPSVSVRGVTRVSADGGARSRRTRGARGSAATYLGQHGRVDSENLRIGDGRDWGERVASRERGRRASDDRPSRACR